MALEVNMFEGTLGVTTQSTNAKDILTSINEAVLYLKTNKNLPEYEKNKNKTLKKVMAMTKPGTMDFLSKSQRVDLLTLSEDELKNLSVEPTIDVYLKEPYTGGRRRSRKSRKSRKSRRR